MLYILTKVLSHASAKRKTERLQGFKMILHFYWSFSSEKGLIRIIIHLQRIKTQFLLQYLYQRIAVVKKNYYVECVGRNNLIHSKDYLH